MRPGIGVPTFDDFSPSDEPSERIKSLCYGCRSFGELRQLNLLNQLQQSIDFNVRSKIDNLAPPELHLPDGSRRQVRYQPGQPPCLSTRFERLFGLQTTPEICGIPITLELLAPNRRPVQITRDLTNFWKETYPQVRKELRGRYPKHPWPEDPLTAKAGLYRRRRGEK